MPNAHTHSLAHSTPPPPPPPVVRGVEVIQSQIQEREQQRLLDMERKDQETQTMLRYPGETPGGGHGATEEEEGDSGHAHGGGGQV